MPEWARRRGLGREAAGDWPELRRRSPKRALRTKRKREDNPSLEASSKIPESERQREGLQGKRRLLRARATAWGGGAAHPGTASARGERGVLAECCGEVPIRLQAYSAR